MIVIPIPDKNNPGRTYVRINDIPCFFPRYTDTPLPHLEVEVMITGVHYFLKEDGAQDKTRPKQLFIRIVTPYYVVANHNGFYINNEGRAVAHAMTERDVFTYVAGRTSVRCDSMPGRIYVRRRDKEREIQRAEGVPDLFDLECHEFFRNIAV